MGEVFFLLTHPLMGDPITSIFATYFLVNPSTRPDIVVV